MKVDTASRVESAHSVLVSWQRRLDSLEAERQKVREELPALIAMGDEKAITRQQDRDDQLTGKIARTRNTVEIHSQIVEQERELERHAEIEKAHRHVAALGQKLVASNAALQVTLELLIKQAADVLADDQAFVSALDTVATASTRAALRDYLVTRDFMKTLHRRIAIATFALSGKDRPLNVVQSDYELRQQGLHLLSKHAADYITDALARANIRS